MSIFQLQFPAIEFVFQIQDPVAFSYLQDLSLIHIYRFYPVGSHLGSIKCLCFDQIQTWPGLIDRIQEGTALFGICKLKTQIYADFYDFIFTFCVILMNPRRSASNIYYEITERTAPFASWPVSYTHLTTVVRTSLTDGMVVLTISLIDGFVITKRLPGLQ